MKLKYYALVRWNVPTTITKAKHGYGNEVVIAALP